MSAQSCVVCGKVAGYVLVSPTDATPPDAVGAPYCGQCTTSTAAGFDPLPSMRDLVEVRREAFYGPLQAMMCATDTGREHGPKPRVACPDCGRAITCNPSGWWSHEAGVLPFLAGECWRVSMDGPN
jgi:hypothetical protein